MDEARKDEVGRKFLLSQHISLEECGELEIQELIFLIHSAKFFKEKESFPQEHLDERIKLFFGVLKDKLKDSESLFIAYEKRTGYPYVDADDRIWMFSKEAYAASAADYFMQQFLMLEMKKVGRDEMNKALGELHILGLRKILLDNGQYHAEVDRDELLPPPDWSGTPEISIPVSNPDLQHAMITFFQAMSGGQSRAADRQLLEGMENRMLDEVIRGKYLLPMQLKEQAASVPDEQGMKTLKEGTVIQFAVLGGEGDSTWLPVFTDWLEFEKAYDKQVWSSNVVTYDDMLALSETMEGIVINYRGIPLQLDAKNKQRIEEYRRERSEDGLA
ncbi:SseB family protein [Fontibacillus sp. BL9]|uniref:SseB family protein n=1 Tax=Fontibacillus sp. BL9 TaxID=3389971 RepID=UPI00397DB549